MGGVKRRNPELETKAGMKWPRNRADHCHMIPFEKMYNQAQNGLRESGCYVLLDEPVHMDIKGNVVEDEAMSFGRPVTLKPKRPDNAFLMDETGNNTHGKDDGRQGGERSVVPRGEVPKQEVGVGEAHFTLAPFNDFLGFLRFIVVIFAAEKLNPLWAMGVDIFEEWNPE